VAACRKEVNVSKVEKEHGVGRGGAFIGEAAKRREEKTAQKTDSVEES
jgi:hypothetical protein